MNKYIIVISAPRSVREFEKLVTHLGQMKPRKFLPIAQPHVVLCEHEGNTAAVYKEVATCLDREDQVLVFQIAGTFRGSLDLEPMQRIQGFFASQ